MLTHLRILDETQDLVDFRFLKTVSLNFSSRGIDIQSIEYQQRFEIANKSTVLEHNTFLEELWYL